MHPKVQGNVTEKDFETKRKKYFIWMVRGAQYVYFLWGKVSEKVNIG
jgi:hypothetical protein